MYNDIKDLKIHASSRAGGRVVRHESKYNPCRRCPVLAEYIENGGDASLRETQGEFGRPARRVA
jgi:hypothetical protein